MANDFQKALELLKSAKSIGLISHVRPDGDAYGAMLGLGLSLKKMKKTVRMFSPDGMNELYRFLPGAQDIEKSQKDQPADCDVWVALDTSTKERLGEVFLSWSFEVDMNLDHHVSSTRFGKINIIRPDLPSTASLVQELIEAMHMPMDAEIATCLFVGVSTDTGSFRYRGTTAEIFRATARLIEAGADPAALAQRCYQSVSLPQFELHRLAMETFTLECDQRLAHLTLRPEMFQKSSALPPDMEGLVEKLQEIATVQASAVFEFGKDYLKVSLRSKGLIDVNQIATEFGGGGHPLAAGIRIKNAGEKDRNKILDRLKEAIKKA